MYFFLELPVVIDLDSLLFINIQAFTLAFLRAPHLQINAEDGTSFIKAILHFVIRWTPLLLIFFVTHILH